MGVSQKCLDNINKMPPPTNFQCPTICGTTDFIDNTHCSTLGVPVDTPILTKDPDCHGKGQACYCYCCCSCFARDTPLEQSPGQFVLVQDVSIGDHLLVSGADLVWKPGIVKTSSGDISPTRYEGMYFLLYKFAEEEQPRSLFVSPDHLFMLAKDRTLKAIQYLITGDELLRNDGQSSEVLFVSRGAYVTTLHTIEMEGAFDGKDLSGHLLNANGLVTTDYVVQAFYASDNIDTSLLFQTPGNENLLEVGDKEYHDRFPSPLLDAFLADRTQWPKGFVPFSETLINIPATARGYVITGYAEQIQANGTFVPRSNTTSRLVLDKLYKYLRVYYPNTLFILDWENDLPNCYTWVSADQQIVLTTGGLLRFEGLYVEGLSLIVSSVVSMAEGAPCVGDADYMAITKVMRSLWPSSMLPEIFPAAIDQVDAVLKNVTKPVLGNPCVAPTTDCRIETYDRAISFLPVPDCAKPITEMFILERAKAQPGLTKVVVTYSQACDPATGTTLANYSFSPAAKVTAAKLSGSSEAVVELTVSELQAGGAYVLTVQNVTSDKEVPIDPKHNSVLVRMPK